MGHCFGAILAYEIARQLQEAGIKVGRVAILDTWMKDVPGSSRVSSLRHLPLFFANLPRWGFHFVFERSLRNRFPQFAAGFARGHVTSSDSSGGSRRSDGLTGSTDKRKMPESLRSERTFFHACRHMCPAPTPARSCY